MVDVRWTGAAGLEFTHSGKTVLIDPYHSRPGKREVLFGRPRAKADLIAGYLKTLPGTLSAIVVGHTHLDHALDIPELSKYLHGPLVGSSSLETVMSIHGLPGRTIVCKGGEQVELPGGARVTMIPSRHGLVVLGRAPYPGEIDPALRPPLKAREYRHGTVFAPKLEIGGVVFMHMGSANFSESALEGHRCDVLFMCVPGWKKVAGYTTRLLQMLRPHVIVPFHFDDFTAPLRPDKNKARTPLQDMHGFRKRIARSAPDAEIRLPRPFERLTF